MGDEARSYRETRLRVRGLVSGLDDAQLGTIAPATPEWRVRDVLAHQAGVASDIVAGELDGVTTAAWTGRQVGARRDQPVARILDEWDEAGATVETMMVDMPHPQWHQLLADVATHEHDIRGALGRPGARDSGAVATGFAYMTNGVGAPMRFETEAGTFAAGPDGEPIATVRADRFELLRAMTGRRSYEQIRDYGWEGEPRPEAIVITPVFTARAEPLVE